MELQTEAREVSWCMQVGNSYLGHSIRALWRKEIQGAGERLMGLNCELWMPEAGISIAGPLRIAWRDPKL